MITEEKYAAVANDIEPLLPVLIDDCRRLVGGGQSTSAKYDRLLEFVERMMEKVLPHTPCGKTDPCSYCCNMAVSIHENEAKRIAQFAGRLYVKQPIWPDLKTLHIKHEAWIARYTNVPCTFLVDNKCSVYPVRPMACRLHHTIADDNKCCDLSHLQMTPALDMAILEKAQVTILIQQAFGDIREYFPPA